MDKPMIGIRQADGSFYEILDETASGHKRLILSAARTDQKGVRIELYRSVNGAVIPEESLGSILLENSEGLGYQDIEFRLDVTDGRLEASAAIPGQPARTLSVDLGSPDDGPHRTDAAILQDDSLGTDLDTLDDSFSETDPEPMTLDLPDLREDETEAGAPEAFDLPDLDESDLSLPGLDEPEPDQPALGATEPALEAFDMPEMDELPELDETAAPALEAEASPADDAFDMPSDDAFDMPAFDEPSPEAATPAAAPETEDEFSLDDLGDMELPDAADELSDPAVTASSSETAEDEFSLDNLGDMEPMEFMDTGDELSSPAPSSPAPAAEEEFDLSTDSDTEFGEMPEFGDLPEMGDLPDDTSASPSSDDDLDFMAPPELTETPWADDPEPVAAVTKAGKAAKKPKTRSKDVPLQAPQGGLDKTALFLSLTSLSLLVLLILVLLFLNMVKSPQAPVIQPEVMKFAPTAPVAAQRLAPVAVDLSAGPTFETSTVLEVPEALRVAEVSLRLAPGDTAADAERRFGPPAKVQGNQLFW